MAMYEFHEFLGGSGIRHSDISRPRARCSEPAILRRDYGVPNACSWVILDQRTRTVVCASSETAKAAFIRRHRLS